MIIGNMETRDILPGYMIVLNLASVCFQPKIKHSSTCILTKQQKSKLNLSNKRTLAEVNFQEYTSLDDQMKPANEQLALVVNRSELQMAQEIENHTTVVGFLSCDSCNSKDWEVINHDVSPLIWINISNVQQFMNSHTKKMQV